MQRNDFIKGLLEYIKNSPTPFHAAHNGADILIQAGFQRLSESDDWSNLKRGKYFVIRNDSSLIGFHLPQSFSAGQGLRMAGSHTDSPCLKVKPNPRQLNHTCLQVGIEVYGGALLAPWFDRDLSLAGRVSWQKDKGPLQSGFIDFKSPVAVIPSLAIHLDREANSKKEINKQTDLVPLLMQVDDNEAPLFKEILQKQLYQEHPQLLDCEIVDHDLFFYDTQPPARTGLNKEFISGARLDNLLSCFILLRSITEAATPQGTLIVLNDHEEVGSVSTVGAQGPFLQSVLERVFPLAEDRHRMIANSLMISVDNAHAVHPNFAAKYEPQHLPLLNKGPVIKWNANQRYASNAMTSALFRLLCQKAEIPVQEFVMRNDMACGSTIGPLTAAELGVPTVDVGIPQLAMHSIRETAGAQDCHFLFKAMKTFFAEDGENIISRESLK